MSRRLQTPSEQDCGTCARLWRQYGEATRNHVGMLTSQQRLAATDPEAATALEPQIRRAAIRREASRAAIETHRAAAHRQKTLTA